jgi:hypothetical protein
MLTLSPSVLIYLHSQPIDMRKSFDGLIGIIVSGRFKGGHLWAL